MKYEKVWLASYPRSGNTLLRSIFYDCFGISTISKYQESDSDPILVNLLGRGVDSENRTDSRFVKTHDHPEDSNAAIYIVRNGMASIVSYRHFMRDFGGVDVSLSDVINGNIMFGSWSDHYNAWKPANRNHTLLIRYEDLISDKQVDTINSIGKFLQLNPLRSYDKKFSNLNLVSGNFFRSGNNEKNISEFSEFDKILFNKNHGKLMAELGYK